MTPDEKVKSILLANTALTALVGTRVNPIEPDRNSTLPLVLYDVARDNDADTYRFLGDQPTNKPYTLEVTAVGRTYAECFLVKAQVEASLLIFKDDETYCRMTNSQNPQQQEGYSATLNFNLRHRG